jgi:polyisoprenoid-binding protein YceI
MDGSTGAKMSSEISTARYTIEPARSRFTVRAFASGLLSSFGHNPTLAVREYLGEVDFAPDSLDGSSLRFRVRADSLSVQDQVSEKDRQEIERTMKEEVLEVKRFSEIHFISTRVTGSQLGETLFATKIEGELSLHGVTREVVLSAQVVPDGDTLRAYGEFSLRQSDFNIKLVSVAAGALKVKDELKLSFDFVARKQG